MIRAAVLTLSDKGSRGEREDMSGPAIKQRLQNIDAEIVSSDILPDEMQLIKERLMRLCNDSMDLILTTGGTGVSPRDVTPDATREVIDYEIPGIAEAMRMEGMKKTPYAMISRAVAGVRGRSLIINLPGSPKAVEENLSVIIDVLPHIIEKIHGNTADCGHIRGRERK